MSGNSQKFSRDSEYFCPCYTKTKVNYRVSGCSDDASAVALLPYHWTPRRGGVTLAKYLKEREENHFKILRDLQKSTSSVNEEIEAKIRVLAETLLCNINNNQCEVDCVVVKQDLIDGILPEYSRKDALKSIEDKISTRLCDISNFKKEALLLENERANGLRKVLHDHFGLLMSVRHESPKELFQQFDEKIYEINQQLLSNCTAYNELEEQLHVQANHSHTKARSLINQLCLGVGITDRGRSALQCPNSTNDINRRSKSANLVNSVHSSLEPSLTTAMELDACVNRFSEEYQNEIGVLYAEFIDKLIDLHNSMGDRNFIQKQVCCAKEVTILERKLQKSFSRISGLHYISTTTINKEPDQLRSGFADCYILIQKSLMSVGNQLKDIYIVLHEASHLWDAHMIRLANAQKLTIAAVEDLTTRHDSLELANDIPFDVTLEQLLTAGDVDKLQLYYEGLCVLLKQKGDEYRNHADLEISRLEEIVKLIVPLTNIIQAEFDLFIEKYPVTTFLSPNVDEKRNVRESHPRISIYKLQTSLPRDIFQTEMQEIALSNWRNGFLETFRNSLPLLSEKLENQVRSWIDERSVPLKRRHSFKMISLDIRKERVIAARDLRLAQLRQHENCLESHLAAVNELANRLPTEVLQLLTLDTPGLHPVSEWIERIRLGMDEVKHPGVDVEVKRLKMMSYATRFANHRRIFEESLLPIVESTKKLMGQRVQVARISNVRYVSHLKLFSEGGNHSAQEVTKICAALVKAGDVVENCMTRTLDAINQCRTELLSRVDQLINPLKAIAEDVLKETGKGIYDRKKAFPNKKK